MTRFLTREERIKRIRDIGIALGIRKEEDYVDKSIA
jgi:hypothetical protein